MTFNYVLSSADSQLLLAKYPTYSILNVANRISLKTGIFGEHHRTLPPNHLNTHQISSNKFLNFNFYFTNFKFLLKCKI